MRIRKIGILVEQLSGGGAERMAGLISMMLTDLGYELTTFILIDDIKYAYAGKLINLGVYQNGSKALQHKFYRYRLLKKQLETEKPDVLLDFRMKNHALREFWLNLRLFKMPSVNMVRSNKLQWYFPNPKQLSIFLYRNYAAIVSVSKMMQQDIEREYGFSNTTTIYNPIDIEAIQQQLTLTTIPEDKFILAVGRLSDVKQFEKLIEAYHQSSLADKNYRLVILGDGPLKETLQQKIIELNLTDSVKLYPFQKNPFAWMHRAKFLVLSSKNEGFPNVLAESLAAGTPVVSFDCSSGPNEIIQHEHNGLLVENQNFEALTQAMKRLFQNEELYHLCKSNAAKSIMRFSISTIKKDWQDFLMRLQHGSPSR